MGKWMDKLSENTICSCFVSCEGRFAKKRRFQGVTDSVCVDVCMCVCVCACMAQSVAVGVEINAENIVAITTAACK